MTLKFILLSLNRVESMQLQDQNANRTVRCASQDSDKKYFIEVSDQMK